MNPRKQQRIIGFHVVIKNSEHTLDEWESRKVKKLLMMSVHDNDDGVFLMKDWKWSENILWEARNTEAAFCVCWMK
jgi:hypothetical protein